MGAIIDIDIDGTVTVLDADRLAEEYPDLDVAEFERRFKRGLQSVRLYTLALKSMSVFAVGEA